MGKKWCENHFTCFGCDLNFNVQQAPYFEWDLKPMCKSCYNNLPTSVKKNLEKYDQIDRKVKKRIEEQAKKEAKKEAKNKKFL